MSLSTGRVTAPGGTVLPSWGQTGSTTRSRMTRTRVGVGGRLPAGICPPRGPKQNRPVEENAVATTVKQLSVSTQRRIGPLSAGADQATRAE